MASNSASVVWFLLEFLSAMNVLLAAAADCPVLGAFPLLNVPEMFRFFLASPL